MTLATHAVVGAAVVSLIPRHPILGFVAAFASHFLVDSIPHGHYRLFSLKVNAANPLDSDMTIGRDFIFDLARTGFDVILGLLISITFIVSWHGGIFVPALFAGAIGGVLPDALQFVYWKIRREPLVSLQKFHLWIHTRKNLNGKFFITFAIEVATMAVGIILVHLLKF